MQLVQQRGVAVWAPDRRGGPSDGQMEKLSQMWSSCGSRVPPAAGLCAADVVWRELGARWAEESRALRAQKEI